MSITLSFLNETEQTINELLLSKGFSSNNIYHLIDEKHIFVDKVAVNGKNQLIPANIDVFVTLNDEINELIPNKDAINIIYEDDYLLIINKPYSLDVEPSRYTRSNNLASMITNYFNLNNIKSKVHLVNRLDKLTTGLVIVAKNQYIKNLFSHVDIIKKYRCLVEGITDEEGTIEIGISKDNGSKHIINSEGKMCKTSYKRIEVIKGNSLLEVQIFTGRTHQIRLSMKSIGHPLLNDPLYGNKQDGRMYLQSYYLKFVHPITNKLIEIII